MTGDPVNETEMPAIDVRLGQGHGYRALRLVGLMLDSHHPVDRLEKLLHVLAFAAAWCDCTSSHSVSVPSEPALEEAEPLRGRRYG